MVQRVTYRRQCSYNTRSNKIKKVKTPGGRLVVQYPRKIAHHDKKLSGIAVQRSSVLKNMSRRAKTVSRIYGGHLTGAEVKNRIIRAFLTEEVKIVKKVMNQVRSQSKKDKKKK